jgi:hypothetical protein
VIAEGIKPVHFQLVLMIYLGSRSAQLFHEYSVAQPLRRAQIRPGFSQFYDQISVTL